MKTPTLTLGTQHTKKAQHTQEPPKQQVIQKLEDWLIRKMLGNIKD